MRNCRHVRELLAGPAGWRDPLIRMRPRRPWGLRNAKLSPPSLASGGPSRDLAAPWEAASCATVATFGCSWEVQRSGVIRKSERGVAVPGGCELRNCRHVRGPPVITPLSDRGLFSAYDMSRKNDAVNCEHVAVARFSWAKRSMVLRTVQGVML